MDNNNSYSDLLNIVSVMLAIQNLKENREQSEHNNVQAANDKQAKDILEAIQVQFKEQNIELAKHKSLLYDIVERLDKIQLDIDDLIFDKNKDEI